ncbi:heterokaryon incompatibility protein-domain-containing protein [Earliella scabrosa]|nr:heterokaryon incompatibility protein-domain-containing protein [Earliella scabrosa]
MAMAYGSLHAPRGFGLRRSGCLPLLHLSPVLRIVRSVSPYPVTWHPIYIPIMWLLDTRTFKLHYFVSPEAVEDGYAILSHVWDQEDQSFQDLQRIHAEHGESTDLVASAVSRKIRAFCKVAEDHCYKWAWIDTCCIDKTSSAELSEAINSMFRYYSLSLVCYAYLADVADFDPSDPDPTLSGSSGFHGSVWHTRGWTLQELIAPQTVLFLSRNWDPIGSKAELADQLEQITGIPAPILRLDQPFAEASIAQRMSWAANRKTTRVEDEAYCLLGLFGINMPTLYGEGRNAFRRLQEEIMRESPDTTLFAWGLIRTMLELFGAADRGTMIPHSTALFAASPDDFNGSGDIRCIVQNKVQRRLRDYPIMYNYHLNGPASFTVTPHGVQAHLPVFEVRGITLGDLSWVMNLKDRGPCSIFLVLGTRVRSPASQSLSLPLYAVGGSMPVAVGGPHFRLAINNTMFDFRPRELVWEDVYLQLKSSSPPSSSLGPKIYIPMNHCFNPPIRVPEACILRFADTVIRPTSGLVRLDRVHVVDAQLPWRGAMKIDLTFAYVRRRQFMTHVALQVGRCSAQGACWANVQGGKKEVEFVEHACPADHILAWPGLTRSFAFRVPFSGDSKWTVGLTVTCCMDMDDWLYSYSVMLAGRCIYIV